MDINKKQLIEQLRYLAEHDQGQLKEILDEVVKDPNNILMEARAEYLTIEAHQKKLMIKKYRDESFKRFDKVYKVLS